MAFIEMLLAQYAVCSARDSNGIDRSNQLETSDPLNGIDGYIHIVLKDGGGMIPHVQLFIDENRDTNEYCLEVTFFPDDIDTKRFSLEAFQQLIEDWNAVLKSDDYFVRYENASWDLYDPSGLGVIYTRTQPPVR